MRKILLAISVFLSLNSFAFKLESSGIINGYIKDEYGKFGTQNIKGMPSLSLPLKWSNIPKNTKSFAIVMEDFDAVPVVGFSWIHWITVVPGNITELKENASLENKQLIQGLNSWISNLGGLNKAEASHYGGPAPPDKTHTYDITIYALDKKLNIKEGFYLNELYKEIEGHVLSKTTIKAKYNHKK